MVRSSGSVAAVAIPTIQKLLRLVLRAHTAEQEMRAGDVLDILTVLLPLTPEERSARQPSGDLVVLQRIGWARDTLVNMGLLERVGHGVTKITARGQELEASGERLPRVPSDWGELPVSRESVLAAIAEFERDGRDETLARHGFRRAYDYLVMHDGEEYDAKALYGIAYGIEHPYEQPIRTRGLQGGREVNRRLEQLGFEVISRRQGEAQCAPAAGDRVWLVRAGREGRYEQLALDEGVCLIGWSELGELPPDTTRERLKQLIAETWDEQRPQSLASQAGQIFRFVHELQVGDVVVLPRMSRAGHVAVGRLAGEYAHRTDGPFAGTDAQHTRAVEWLARELPYERFDPDLREAFGQQGTVSEIGRPDAAQRLLDAAAGADASAIHLVLKWSAALGPDTIEQQRAVVAAHGASWFGRQGRPGVTGLGETWIASLRAQLERGSETFVFLHGAPSTWRTRLLEITTDEAGVDPALRPPGADPDAHHTLWVKLTEFEQVDPSELVDGYVLAQSGGPVTAGGLGNQGPLIVRARSAPRLRPGSAGAAAAAGGAFDLDAIRAAAASRDLTIAPEIHAQVLAALESGKHVILTGPPGTAKTTYAQAVADAAQAAGRCDGYVLSTATADWTTYETIGGLRPTGPSELVFEEGHFLSAIRDRHWLVIDELNRAHFDRAFGQLFTVLSGQPVVLPYRRAGQDGPLALVPEGADAPVANADVLEIPQSWRVIATMNVFDKTLLFEMSFALMRRFAFVEVASPSAEVFDALVGQASAGDERAAALARQLLVLRELKDLGPAVFMDLARFLRERLTLGEADDGQLLFEGFYSYLLPQFEGIDAVDGERLLGLLAPLMRSRARRERLRATLETVLGLELARAADAADEDVVDADEAELADEPLP